MRIAPLLAPVMVVVIVSSCGASRPECTPASCAGGCCDASGECVAGTGLLACGGGGGACAVCELDELCGGDRTCQRFPGGVYDASFPDAPDASVRLDAGTFTPPSDGGADGGGVDAGPVDAGPVSFSAQIIPILDKCAACHAWGHGTTVGVNAGGGCMGFGPRIVAGNPVQSVLFGKVSGAPACGGPMPPDTALPAADVATLRQWILEGARNN